MTDPDDLPTVDLPVLRRLGEQTGPDMLPVLVESYVRELSNHGEVLEDSLHRRDLARIAGEAHRLKGGAKTFGALALAARSTELDFLASEGNELAFTHTREALATIRSTVRAFQSLPAFGAGPAAGLV